LPELITYETCDALKKAEGDSGSGVGVLRLADQPSEGAPHTAHTNAAKVSHKHFMTLVFGVMRKWLLVIDGMSGK
jgi:hypothetical protein